MYIPNYKKNKLLQERQIEANHILMKFPDRIPIIVEQNKSKNSIPLAKLNKKKYLVPNTLTCGQFMYVLRKRIHLQSEQALFMFVLNSDNKPIIPLQTQPLSYYYNNYKCKDNFMYIVYSSENTFG